MAVVSALIIKTMYGNHLRFANNMKIALRNIDPIIVELVSKR